MLSVEQQNLSNILPVFQFNIIYSAEQYRIILGWFTICALLVHPVKLP